ncbi:MAG: superoxide dismutase family protein [Proteobacteria bacterium]|nr:superoxide dismutase family protein [Pseudomonadota bacterium]
MKISKCFLWIVVGLFVNTAYASEEVVMHFTTSKGVGKSVGTITLENTPYGLLLTPHLSHLEPGAHGFHIHEIPNCDDNGNAAGGHFDPKKTGKHLGPYNDKGHLGDLPVLVVNEQGQATLPVLAPRLKLAELRGHSIMMHEHGDNYSDFPEKMGGGGGRRICGVIKQ